jgi:hypothetical protein
MKHYLIIFFLLINISLYSQNRESIIYPDVYKGTISGASINAAKYILDYVYISCAAGYESTLEDDSPSISYPYIKASIGMPILEAFAKMPLVSNHSILDSMIYGVNINFDFRLNKYMFLGFYVGVQQDMLYKYAKDPKTSGNLSIGIKAGYTFGDTISKDKIRNINETGGALLNIFSSASGPGDWNIKYSKNKDYSKSTNHSKPKSNKKVFIVN